MGLLRRRPQARSLTAAAVRIDRKNSQDMRRLVQPWQSDAFYYYHQIGEVRFSAQFYARMLSRLRLYVGVKDEHGEVQESDDPKEQELVQRLQDPGGGQSGWLGGYGRLRFLTGESYLLMTFDEDGNEQWESVSTDELRVNPGGGYTRFRAPSVGQQDLKDIGDDPPDSAFQPLGDKAAVYRLWRKDPQWSDMADSPMRAVLQVCEELLTLTQAVRSRARSRLAGAGVLMIPSEITFPPLEPTGDENMEQDPAMKDLIDASTAAIQDPSSAAAQVPIIWRVPGELIKQVVHLQIHDPLQTYPEQGLRKEAIERFALGADFPPEVLLGMGDVNHWQAWLVSEQTWNEHGAPVANELVDELTGAYLRPTAKEAGLERWKDLVVAYDAAEVVQSPDRTDDAKALYDRRAIGKAALRRPAGFTDEDAPTEDELNEMLGVATRDSSLAVYGIPQIRGTGGLEPEAGEISQGMKGEVTDAPTGPVTGSEAEKGPPEMNGARTAAIVGAATLAHLRAREVAGNRVRSLARRDPETLAMIDGVPPSEVPAALGPERVRALRAGTERELVGAAHALVVDAFRSLGLARPLAEKVAEQVEQHAARTLYERQASLPRNFQGFVHGLTM